MRKRKKNNFIRNLIIEHINENSKSYILLILIFFIGLSIGIICINNTNEEGQNQISSYINNFTNVLKSEENVNINNVLIESIKNDITIVLLLCLLGSTVIGIPLIYLIILYKGYSFGYTIASIFACLGRNKGKYYLFNFIYILSNIYSSDNIYICKWNKFV